MSEITQQLGLLNSYAAMMPGDGTSVDPGVSAELTAVAGETDVDLAEIADAAVHANGTAVSAYIDDDAEGRVGAVQGQATDADVERLRQWHVQLAGEFAGEIDGLKVGENEYKLTDVKLGADADVFTFEFAGHTVDVTYDGSGSMNSILEDMKGLADIFQNDPDGAVGTCKYRAGEKVVFHSPEVAADSLPSTDFAPDAIAIFKPSEISLNNYMLANVVRISLGMAPNTDWQGIPEGYLVDSVQVDRDNSIDVCIRDTADPPTYEWVGIPDGLNSGEIRTTFSAGMQEIIDAKAAAPIPDDEAPAPDGTGTTESGVNADPLSILFASDSTQEAKLAALGELPALYATADATTASKIFKAVFVALNANGGTDEGKALNKAGIKALGGLTGSVRAARILSQIAINAHRDSETYNSDYSGLAQSALETLNSSSTDNNAIAALLAQTNSALA